MEELSADTERFMTALYRIGRYRHALFGELLSRHGVTLQQFHLLMHMKAGRRARVTDLSEMMMVSKPTASRMINTLCERGMLRKRADGGDRRLVFLELTPRGRRVAEEKEAWQMEMVARMQGKMDAAEMEALLGALEKVEQVLAAIWAEKSPGGGGA